MQHSFTAILAWLIATLIGGAAAAADRPGFQLNAQDFARNLADARVVEGELRVAAGIHRRTDGDHVAVISSGGMFAHSEMVTLYPTADGGWRVEKIVQRYRFRHDEPVKLPIQVTTAAVAPELSLKVRELVDQDALYQEPAGLEGTCTDQPYAVLEVVWKGRRREAVRLSCPRDDLTWHLISTAWEAAEAADHEVPKRPTPH